ncbi:kinase-like protein [Xylariaceae sp. FL0594]|nr:kinase-like protein [Xylariaceae sp. FL0594]
MSLPFLKTTLEGAVTVMHRVKTKSRAPTRSIERPTKNKPMPVSAPAILSVSTSNSNTNSSGKSSGPATTAKTSFESKLSSKDNDLGEKRPATVVNHDDPETPSKLAEPSLSTIQEKEIEWPSPTIRTVEKAAAAKIYLETYFNGKFNSPSSRSLRRRYLESELYRCLDLGTLEKDMRRALFCRQETDHLRESRVLAAKSIGAIKGEHNELADGYEVLKILGKGSFGVVRLVRERTKDGDRPRGRVYAMKVIRKSAMLKTSQEGHLRAERDFLVASEGSRWIVPLISSFQDARNLYLVMDYMPGGDFLGLLIRENILSEPVAKFYIAEMILCIEEAHSLRCIHRDIKPDNFLISATGHLKISDFGLAFDGHWSHDTSYYHTQRYSLLQKLGLSVEGDHADRAEGIQGTMKWTHGVTQAMRKHEWQPVTTDDSPVHRDEPLLNWRNREGIRSSARSCVGTSQYMAPEVIREEEGGRQQTKRNIVNHEETFAFPPRPVISRRCMDLIANLVCERDHRLSSSRYRTREMGVEHPPMPPGKNRLRARSRDQKGRAVYPQDAEDIKAHKWFRDIPWEQLHLITPPFVPRITSIEDTHYFDEEEPISDWSESGSDDDNSSSEEENAEATVAVTNMERNPLWSPAAIDTRYLVGPCEVPNAASPHNIHSPPVVQRKPEKLAAMQEQLSMFPPGTRAVLAQFVASPYDSTRLKRMDREIEAMAEMASEYDHDNHNAPSSELWLSPQNPDDTAGLLVDKMKAFVRAFGKRERKRPRDRLLRDRKTKATVMEIRKQTAFLGYSFKRAAVVAIPGLATFDGTQEGLDDGLMACCASQPGSLAPGCAILGCLSMQTKQGTLCPRTVARLVND